MTTEREFLQTPYVESFKYQYYSTFTRLCKQFIICFIVKTKKLYRDLSTGSIKAIYDLTIPNIYFKIYFKHGIKLNLIHSSQPSYNAELSERGFHITRG